MHGPTSCFPHANPVQAQADDVARQLDRGGVKAAAYHAGKDMNERTRVQVSDLAD